MAARHCLADLHISSQSRVALDRILRKFLYGKVLFFYVITAASSSFFAACSERATPTMSTKLSAPPRRSFSLPTRLSLAVTLTLVVTTVLADVMAMLELRKNLAGSVSSSLNGMIKRMARQLDDDLTAMIILLREEAGEVKDKTPEETQTFLNQRASALGFAFDYGVVLVDAAGIVRADSLGRDWTGVNVAGEEFFQRTFALDVPLISEPFVSPLPDATPVAMFTAPILGAEGKTLSLLAGGVNLADNRTLNQPTGVRASQYGQIGLFTASGVVVAHSDKGQLLEHFENPLDDALSGDGVAELTAADGTKTILAVAELASADWVLAGAFPAREVNAPIEKGFAAAHLWLALGLAVCCLLAWRIAGRAVRDLGRLSQEMAGIGDEDLARGRARVGDAYRDEAGAMAATVNAMLDSLARARRDIGDLSYRLAGAQERERRAIAADLHDSVCQSLALANMQLGGLRKKLTDRKLAASAEQIQHILENSVSELRTLTFNLSPNILYELGLAPALEWHAEGFAKKYSIPFRVSGADTLSGLDEGLAIFLYRAAGELLTNAAKHAQAKQLEVEVGKDGDDAFVEVRDDGRGMGEAYSLSSGFGLRHLRERVRQLNGTMQIADRLGGGTTVRLTVPAG